jgi:hypothetical protein
MEASPRPVLKSIEPEVLRSYQALDHFVTASGMRVTYYSLSLDKVPADFFADPDGAWSYELLARAAGFASHSGVAIGALKADFNGHPEGAAVITLNALTRPYVAIVECPIAYDCTSESEESSASSAA